MGGRPYYAEYVNHCLRFYCQTLKRPACFRSNVDMANWTACDAVLKDYSFDDRNLIIAIYSGRDTLGDNVYQVSKRFQISQDAVWNLIHEVSRRIAKRRGLL